MAEVKITYETLFDLLRREKSREELQELDPSFYADVIIYLKGKQTLLKNDTSEAGLFGASETEKVRIQIQNIKKMVKELYEKRERKIIQLAINRSKTGSTLINMTALLPEEKSFFENTLVVLNNNRESVLKPIIFFENNRLSSRPVIQEPTPEPVSDTDIPSEVQSDTETEAQSNKVASATEIEKISEAQKTKFSDAPKDELLSVSEVQSETKQTEQPAEEEKKEDTETKVSEVSETKSSDDAQKSETQSNKVASAPKDELLSVSDIPQEPKEQPAEEEKKEVKEEDALETPEETVETTTAPADEYDIKVNVKFLAEVPKFVGKKLETYGPYAPDDTAELPQIIANILINKGRAEKVE